MVSEYLGYELQIGAVGEIDPETLKAIDAEMAHQYGIVPLYLSEGGIHFLTSDPFNSAIIDDLTFALNMEIFLVVCDPLEIEQLLEKHYSVNRLPWIILSARPVWTGLRTWTKPRKAILTDAANETPIIRFVNLVMQQAIGPRLRIFTSSRSRRNLIRYRVDGALYEMSPPPKSLALPVISRIKVIADLNIAEHRIPQDGRIKMTIEGRAVDLRVSTLPTQFGESVVLRVLDKSAVNLDLESLGLTESVKKGIRDAVRRPNGIFIVTGPTGSGKTTTLYSALERGEPNGHQVTDCGGSGGIRD